MPRLPAHRRFASRWVLQFGPLFVMLTMRKAARVPRPCRLLVEDRVRPGGADDLPGCWMRSWPR